MNDDGNVKNEYFEWLCKFVETDMHNKSYIFLLSCLYSTEFYSFVPHDDNRIADTIELRRQYYNKKQVVIDWEYFMDLIGRSNMLEIIICLSIALEDMIVREDDFMERPEDRFWELIENCGLISFDDTNRTFCKDDVDLVTTKIMDRKYDYDGHGGLFPIKRPLYDARKIELWQQMWQYVRENQGVKWK